MLPRPLLLPLFLTMLMGGGVSPAAARDPAPAVDFSFAGWRAGVDRMPVVPAVLRVAPSGGDDTARLQAAVATLAQRAPDAQGWRGALQLDSGTYRLSGTLQLQADGVVLRGAAAPAEPTVLMAVGARREPLLVLGRGVAPRLAPPRRVIADAAAGAMELTVENAHGWSVGDRVVVHRPSTREWIDHLSMASFPGHFAKDRTHWTPGSRDLRWDRVLTAVDPVQGRIRLDAPITTALEARMGGGTVAAVVSQPPVRQLGVEDLVLEATGGGEGEHLEERAWMAVTIDHAEDVTVRRVVARRFVSAAVRVGERGRRVTIEDCRSEEPVSELGGYRREAFLVLGQQVLVRGCTADAALNAFALGFAAAGPNAFVDCKATAALGPVGPAESWAAGFLYENVTVEGAPLRVGRDDDRTQGAGWTAAHAWVWNCTAAAIDVQSPPGAENFVVQAPYSLFQCQRAARGLPAEPRAPEAVAAAAPTPALFAGPELTVEAPPRTPPLEIINGRFVVGDRALWGGAVNAAWWRGQISREAAPDHGVSLTRFVPGRQGPGLTENLPELAARLATQGTPFFQTGPGLWYDRRRDDHRTLQRADATVWAPFYEMPWARSGQGRAQDGLSLYDLSRFNPWYFARLREFAQLSRVHGLVLYNNLHNTHNLLETFAHWVDSPWRPANHLNDIGLPEPPPLDANNAVHLANQVYNVDHPERRALHRAYIRRHLEALGDQTNVVHTVAFQFAGPLAFQQFFLDTVAEWETETGRDVRVALVTSRDITEAVLRDPQRAPLVDVVDMRYWQTLADGTEWAPRGDRNLAFREMNAEQFGRGADTPPDSTPWLVYRQVRAFRDRYPEKAVVAWHGGVGPVPVLLAGGAQVLMRNPAAGQGQVTVDRSPIDAFVQQAVTPHLMNLLPQDGWWADAERVWCLADPGARHLLVARFDGAPLQWLHPPVSHRYRATWVEPATGNVRPGGQVILDGRIPLAAPLGGDALLWLEALDPPQSP